MSYEPAALTCPNCESSEVGTFRSDNWFLYGVGKQYRLVSENVLFFHCIECGLEYTGEDGEKKRLQAVRDHLARIAHETEASLDCEFCKAGVGMSADGRRHESLSGVWACRAVANRDHL